MNETMQGDGDILGIDDVVATNTSVDDLNSVVNLIFTGVDQSSSMYQHIKPMEKSLVDFKGSIGDSKDADDILLARANFGTTIEIQGYKPVAQFDTSYTCRGNTALYDLVCEGTEKLLQYMKYLKAEGMIVKAVFSIFSDGEDTCSKKSLADARRAISQLNDAEVVTAFISFGNAAEPSARAMGFMNILTVGADASELRRAFNVLSKSVVDQSRSATANTTTFF